jgi:outer membrane protein OmpA-like peptidoglycan-associated protein
LILLAFLGIALCLEAQPSAPLLPPAGKPVMQLPANLLAMPIDINSPYEESAPVISADGNVLYFSRRLHPQNFGADKAGDIWMSKRKMNGSWTRPVNVGAPLNNTLHNVPLALDPSGEVIYVMDSYNEAGEGLACSQRDGRSWSTPQVCTITDFYTIGDGATFQLAADGNTLVMALERREGLGRRDIYVSFRETEHQWSAPLHLGNTINTPKEEARAFLAADGITLYFASRGHGGRGGFDLFYSRRLDDSWTNWSAPQNLGETINSPYDDEYISLPAQGDPAYLVYRDTNSMNIYTASLPLEFRPEPVKLVQGKVRMEEEDSREVQVISLDLNSGQVPRALPIREDGSFAIIVPAGEEMGLQVDAPGYFPVSTYVPGNNLEVQEEERDPMLASTEWSQDYLKRDGEIRNLRLRLNQVDEELAELRKQKEAYLNTLREEYPEFGSIRYSDPELDALRHKYEELNRPVIIDTVPPPPVKEDWQSKGSVIPEKDRMRGTPDDELAEMKKRFNRFYQPATQEKEEEDQFLWDEAKSFTDFQEEVEEHMMQEMRPKVGRDLTQSLWPQVRASLQGSLDPKSMKILDEKEYEIREQIAQSLEHGIMALEQAPIRMPEWQDDLEAEIRSNLEPQVRSRLEDELKDEVRQALTNEAFYQIRQQEADLLDQRLKENIRLQMQEEERRQTSGMASEGQMRDIQVKGVRPVPAVYEEERREFQLLKAEKGAIFPLNNVFFKPNTDLLKEVSYTELERVVAFLADHPQITAEVAAHTNGWLSHSLSLELSEQRARTVYDYLLSRGIAGERLQFRGYGKTKPIAPNDTLEGRRKNQRVELHILDN